MNSSNYNSNIKLKSIGWKLSGLSEKLNYQDKKHVHGVDCQHREDSLGNTREIRSHYEKRHKRLRAVQEQIFINKGVQKAISWCRRLPNYNLNEVVATEGKKNGKFKGLICCGSSHCPTCSEFVSKNQRNRLKKVIEYSKSNDLSIAMMTLTFSHKLKDNFRDVLDKLITAKTYFMRQRKLLALDIQWNISRLEFTHSNKNGFHSHFHIAFGVKSWDARNEHFLKIEWMKVCKKFGISCSYDNGLDIIIDKDFKEVENYIMKPSKDIVYEVGSNGTKTARGESVSIEYLIDIIAGMESDERYNKDYARMLLEMYYVGIKGRSIFSANKKFTALVRLIENEEVEEQIEEVEEEHDEQQEQETTVQPCIRIRRDFIEYLSRSKQLFFIDSFISHNNLTKLYDDLNELLQKEKFIIYYVDDDETKGLKYPNLQDSNALIWDDGESISESFGIAA